MGEIYYLCGWLGAAIHNLAGFRGLLAQLLHFESQPMRDLRRSSIDIEWTDELVDLWVAFKAAISSAAQNGLGVYSSKQDLTITVDASTYYWSLCILQFPSGERGRNLDDLTEVKPTNFRSGKFTPTQAKYHISQNELLSYPSSWHLRS